MGTRKTYSADFKRQAIQLATQPDHTVDEIARDLGIGRSTSKTSAMPRGVVPNSTYLTKTPPDKKGMYLLAV